MDLVDLKNGIQYNPKTGEDEYITDSIGNRVRYRSIEEAYKVSNYFDTMNKARIDSYKEVNEKLTARNAAPVVLDVSETAPLETTYTEEQMRELMATPERQLKRNPQLRQQVENLYASLGMEAPKYKR